METATDTMPPKPKTNNPSGLALPIDRGEMFELRATNGLSANKIAKLMHIAPRTVRKWLKKWNIPSKQALDHFKATRGDQLANNQRRVQDHVTKKKLKDSTLSQLVMAQSKYFEMERLENDLSTANHAIKQGNIDDMDKDTIKIMRKLARLVPEMLDEAEDAE